MIFIDKYNGNESELSKNAKFREFNLRQSGDGFTTRSLGLIYDMYCRWLNTTYGVYLVKVNVSIPDSSDICSESVIDYLFHRIQRNVGHRNTCSDNSIGLIWKTYRQNFSTIHNGYFLVSMSETEIYDSPRGEMALLSNDVNNIFSSSLSQCSEKFGIKVELCFMYSVEGEGAESIFYDSSFKVHEQGFTTLCEIARLPTGKQDAESALFRIRYGYNPGHWRSINDSHEPFVIQAQRTKPFESDNRGEYSFNPQIAPLKIIMPD